MVDLTTKNREQLLNFLWVRGREIRVLVWITGYVEQLNKWCFEKVVRGRHAWELVQGGGPRTTF